MIKEIFIGIFLTALLIRISALILSIKNERKLKSEGAKEYGKINTLILISLHFIFYVASFAEGIARKTQFGYITKAGIAIYVFSILVLLLVIHELKKFWTVKIIIAKKHKLNTSFIFKYIRHPNYFLNVLPELIGITLIFKSWLVFLVLFPVYVISLAIRISQEEKIMKQKFKDY